MTRRIAIVALVIPFSANAQAKPSIASSSLPDTARYQRTAPELRGLRWRLVGPFRGGRAVAVTGDPSNPRVFYFGAVDGGVWKTTNAGVSWTNVPLPRSSIY